MPRAKASSSPVVTRIKDSGREIHTRIVGGRKPSMKFPLRSLSNVRYTPRKGHFELKGKKKERTLTVSTVKTFAQTLRMIALSKQLIEADDIASAESIALAGVLPELDRLNEIIAVERNEAAGRLDALRTSAGTLARLASLGVALIIPGIAFFVFRGAMRRRQRNAELKLELKQ